MDLTLLIIIAAIVVIGVFLIRSSAPNAAQVLDKPAAPAPEANKAPVKKARAKPGTKPAVVAKTARNASKSRKTVKAK